MNGRGVAGTATQGRVVAREAGRLARELLRISVGSSAVAPAKGDLRFADPTWTENPAYRRIGQAYLSLAGSMDRLVDEAEKSGQDPDKVRFAVTLLTSAMAPTNFWLGNPAAIKRTLETGGGNLTRGVRNWAGDLRHNGGLPSMTDPQALQVGRDLALTPGAVVERDEVAELIQYTPVTGSVRERPVLVVPPPIGRFYFLDLRPGRSFIEYSVGRGQLLISYHKTKLTTDMSSGHRRSAADRAGETDTSDAPSETRSSMPPRGGSGGMATRTPSGGHRRRCRSWPTALYHYIESKQHYLFVILGQAMADFRARFEHLADSDRPPTSASPFTARGEPDYLTTLVAVLHDCFRLTEDDIQRNRVVVAEQGLLMNPRESPREEQSRQAARSLPGIWSGCGRHCWPVRWSRSHPGRRSQTPRARHPRDVQQRLALVPAQRNRRPAARGGVLRGAQPGPGRRGA